MAMTELKKQLIYGADGKPVAVVLDVETFREVEELLEDVADLKIVEERRLEDEVAWDTAKRGL
jgi:hypothetical protein